MEDYDEYGGVDCGNGWIKYVSEEGYDYYYNAETEETSWELPGAISPEVGEPWEGKDLGEQEQVPPAEGSAESSSDDEDYIIDGSAQSATPGPLVHGDADQRAASEVPPPPQGLQKQAASSVEMPEAAVIEQQYVTALESLMMPTATIAKLVETETLERKWNVICMHGDQISDKSLQEQLQWNSKVGGSEGRAPAPTIAPTMAPIIDSRPSN